ncbi:hypothetical protein LC593_35965 [Nostoc sp. CHAB 5844]|nr:hypothetical protein [Nostoc sp. CHAB 5844]
MPLTIPSSTYANQINFTPTGNINATNVQSAITKLDLETVHTSGNENIGGVKIFTDTTDSTNSTSGGVQCRGGLGVGKNLSIGGSLLLSNYPSLIARRTTNLTLTSGQLTNLPYNSEDEDSHNAYSGGIFTVPANCGGKYKVTAQVSVNFFNASVAGVPIIVLYVYVNGQQYACIGRTLATGISGANDGCGNSVDLPGLVPGNTIEIRVSASFNGTITVSGSDKCALMISRIA